MTDRQILTVAQMQAAEQAIFDTGTSVTDLMEIAASGAAEWIRRIAAGRPVSVLCGPGNNGGDGYVIARKMRAFGNSVCVVAPVPPKTQAAVAARSAWGEQTVTSGGETGGGVLVDCLFGSGLSRPLTPEHVLLLRDLASRHDFRVAVDLPSGVEGDSGALLNDRLPLFDATLALGAWKFAHWSLPARKMMGTKRLVPIGLDATEGAARLIGKPDLEAPADDAHKYTRGLAAIVGGAMPGAAILASTAAQRAGAGYVKLLAEDHKPLDPGLVCDAAPLAHALDDPRISAVLVGPGLGCDEGATKKLDQTLHSGKPVVLDADALVQLRPEMLQESSILLATPHDGELESMCRAFAVVAEGRRQRATALAQTSGIVICAKGPDTVIAAPDGRIAIAPPATSWLSVAGSGDVLAGIAVSRMANGRAPFEAACEAVWLHSDTARSLEGPFTSEELARSVNGAYVRCL